MVDTDVISQCLIQTTSRGGEICMGGVIIIYILDILRVKNYLQVRKCKKYDMTPYILAINVTVLFKNRAPCS